MPTKDFIEFQTAAGPGVRADFVAADIVRVRVSTDGRFGDSLLNRYGFILPPGQPARATIRRTAREWVGQTASLTVHLRRDQPEIRVTNARGELRLHQVSASFAPAGTVVRLRVAPEEDWLGFGDQTRERLYHRGHVADCHVRNVNSYVPVPFFMSSRGVTVLVNTTHRIVFDLARTDPECLEWRDGRTTVDYYVMAGSSYRDLLEAYTRLTGRPKLPPQWSFGLWYICRTQANDYEAVNDAHNLRREGIPCDIIGLEPGWMQKNYDASTQKSWSQERFPIPSYCQTGPHNFFNALRRMGFHLELWLCNDYDLVHEAERQSRPPAAGASPEPSAGFYHSEAEQDEHFSAPMYLDRITKREEPWFEHLKKFVDQGVDFFKQDGAYQVLDHPDRRWAHGLADAEVHNLYPLLYARQMLEGFEAHTGRRGLTFTPCGWTGFQAWAGTWTGDTGGRLSTLGAMLNTAIVGHSWATNDMEVAEKAGIHFGYLLPWSQINSWNYFRMPWLQGRELTAMHRDYSRLRARLIPYLYTWAQYATQAGYPLMVPLVLEFPEDPTCRQILHEYLLGRDLLVTIYKPEVYLPAGQWKDYWTGAVLEGGRSQTISWPEDRGGGLFLRAGAIVPLAPLMQYRGEIAASEIEVVVFPGPTPSTLDLYEDDGNSLEYRRGRCARTRVCTHADSSGAVVEVGPTVGEYVGQPADRTWSLRIGVGFVPGSVKVNGKRVAASAWSYDATRGEVVLGARPGPLRAEVRPA